MNAANETAPRETEAQTAPPALEAPSPPTFELPVPIEWVVARVPFLRSPATFGFRFVTRWGEDACPLMAAALAFFGLLSMFPLALAGVTILASTLAGNSDLLEQFLGFVASFFPGAAGGNLRSELERAIIAVAMGANVTFASLFGLASLLWAGRAYFDTLATVLNRVFPGSKPRPFLQHQLVLWSLLIGTGLLFVLSSFATFGLSVVRSLAEELPNLFFNRAPLFWAVLGRIVGWALTFLMFYLLYRFTPNRTEPPRQRMVATCAVVAALGWEIGKWAFTLFLGNVTRYEAAYGSVAGIVVTLLWIYYASLIVLAGAEVGATWEDLRCLKNKEKGA